MKCSGLRVHKGEDKACGRNAKAEFDGFCSAQHRNEAERLIGADAFSTHVRCIQQVAGNANLLSHFNKSIRVQFVSMLEARKHTEAQLFLQSVGQQYAVGVQSAWLEASAVSGTSSVQHEQIADAANTRRAVKRRSEHADYASVLQEKIAEFESVSGSSSGRSSVKRSKSREELPMLEAPLAVEAMAVDADELSAKLQDLNMLRACNTPLPDSDDVDLE